MDLSSVSIVIVCYGLLYGEGAKLFLRGERISTGSIAVTNIGGNDENGLVCQSDVSETDPENGEWYLTDTSNQSDGAKIISDDPRGWSSADQVTDADGHKLVLKRTSERAVEGIFTCVFSGDSNSSDSLLIIYPMTVNVSLEVVSGRHGEFTVSCSASGGVLSTGSLTGPGLGGALALQPVGDTGRTGQNTYSVTSDSLLVQNLGDTYSCVAMNNVSLQNSSVELRGAGNPVVTEIVQVSAMIIRVMWTPPTEGAAVTAYIVHYRDGCGTANSLEDLPPTSTSADIKWFTTGGTLFVSVEATSQFFSGESEEKSIALPGPVIISAFPSFFNITITWTEPAVPNGIITSYDVTYGQTGLSQSSSNNGLNTSFTVYICSTGLISIEFIFIVRAHTQFMAGVPAAIVASTLTHPPAVEGVRVVSFNVTAVNVFWNPLVIPGFPIKYMVVYSSEEQTSDTLSAVFQAPATSGLVTDLEPSLAYHFSVFASVTVHGNVVVGDNSSTIHFLNDDADNGSHGCSHKTNIVIFIIISVAGSIGTVVGALGLIFSCISLRKKRSNTGVEHNEQCDMNQNPVYGTNLSQSSKPTNNIETDAYVEFNVKRFAIAQVKDIHQYEHVF